MANTFIKIASVTVGSSGAADIDFQNIPQTYTDLKLVVSVRSLYSGAQGALNIAFNNETATTNYSGRYIYATGGGANTYTFSDAGVPRFAGDAPANTGTANVFSNNEIYIPNYALTNLKSWGAEVVAENNTSNAAMNLMTAIWANTAAITRITLTQVNGSNFVQYSTATLYGIKSS